MKTTIDLPDDLLHRAKIVAAQRKTTLKEIVQEGVNYVISHPVPNKESDRKATLARLIAAMKASNTDPMVPLSREEIYAER